MKKVFTFMVLVIVAMSIFGQVSSSFKYQAVLRDARGNTKANTATQITISVLKENANGTVVFSETHSTTTDGYGLINLEIGKGTPKIATLSDIDWGVSTYFIKVNVDGVEMGTSQLLSVPYALYAKTAGNVTGNIFETDPVFTGSQAAIITANHLTNLNNLSGVNTGDQNLSDLATTASLTSALGNKVDKVAGKGLSANDYTTAEKTKLTAIKGVNTGDKDITAMAHSNRTALDVVTGKNTGDQDISGLATTISTNATLNNKVDKIAGKGLSTTDFTTAEKSKLAAITGSNTGYQDITDMTHSNRIALDSVSGKNTGDQDLASILVKGTDAGNKKIVNAIQLGVGTVTPDLSSALEIKSTTQGFLPPRMTYVQKLAIVSPASGLLIWCSNCGVSGEIQVFNGSTWTNIIGGVTIASLPIITLTTSVYSITKTTATSGGSVTSDGGATITSRGVCWSTSSNPTVALSTKTADGTGTGVFTSLIAGLTSGYTYYVRSYATNSIGTAYGIEVSFVANIAPIQFNSDKNYGSLTDIEGNVYKTVVIGNQLWMAENLRTSTFNDGSSIPIVNDNTAWSNLNSSGFSWYNNDPLTFKNTYGALYNWYVVNTNKLCPVEWHVPSDQEWTVLINYLGGASVAGGKLKESGTYHWLNPNIGATNESGFTGLPGALRNYNDGNFSVLGGSGSMWSSFDSNVLAGNRKTLYASSSNVGLFGAYKQFGFSVRCISDLVKLPVLVTTSITSITTKTASSGGNITSDGGGAITARGVCWSAKTNPTIENSKTTNATGSGIFFSSLADLNPGTTYYVRAYATNAAGTGYGNQINFTMLNIPSYVPSNGLVAWWPFNGNANDESGNGNDGTVNGAIMTIDRLAKINSSYSFNGTSNYIESIVKNIPLNNSPRSISGWFKASSIISDFIDPEICVVNYGTLNSRQRFSLCIYSKGYLEPVSGADFSNDFDFYINNYNYLNNDWYFFTLVYDGIKVSLFVNGNYIAGRMVNLNTLNNTFRIGRRIAGDSQNDFFKGTIDDIGIWNRALTQQEITNLFNSN